MKVKQRSAFPPNYIHSIDSSHMMRTAIACVDAGLTFAGVHDSFWTHATDVDTMNVILREKFIEVHKEPLLENLYHEFRANYPDVADEFPQPPAPGDLDLDVVRWGLKLTIIMSNLPHCGNLNLWQLLLSSQSV